MEQALVFASIIIGVAISDQVMSLHRLLRSPVPVRWHWAQPWFAAIVLMTDMMMWWAFASQPAGPVSIGAFLPKVVELILLALLTVNSLPDNVAEDGTDLADYYQRNRRYQWTLLAIALGWVFAVDLVATVRGGTALSAFLLRRSADIGVIFLLLAMGTIRRWRGVAIGLALTSVGPILWLARTIG
ncbi:hypothetical protein ABDK56_03760 [Sphingomonas sp. ASV193]|uniref:hypothetical protein n=1 Tax=Sphingomonas sp. ASV193 TaxID=3144405 RepID=UPI0032E8580F